MIKYLLLFLCIFFLISCDGGIRVKIYTYEKCMNEGIYNHDTLATGIPVPNTFLKLSVASRDSTFMNYIDYSNNLQTDSSGIFYDHFTVPPMKMEKIYYGSITTEKEGYKKSKVIFRHSSVDSIFCIINMEKL